MSVLVTTTILKQICSINKTLQSDPEATDIRNQNTTAGFLQDTGQTTYSFNIKVLKAISSS